MIPSDLHGMSSTELQMVEVDEAAYEDPHLSAFEEECVMTFMTETNTAWLTALKFLSATGFETSQAVERWKRCKNHLSNEGINPLPEPTASLIHYLTVPLFYLPSSVDRDGSTLLVFNARYWVADEAGTRRMLKLLNYICHKAASKDETRRGGITLISNLEKLDRRYDVVEVHRWIMEMLEYYLPVALNKVLIYNAPWWATMFPYAYWPGACTSGPLRAEMIVCKDLVPYIERSNLPRKLGGDLLYKHKEWVADQLRIEQCGEADVMVEVDLGQMEARVFSSSPPTPISTSTSGLRNYTGIQLGTPIATPACDEESDGYFSIAFRAAYNQHAEVDKGLSPKEKDHPPVPSFITTPPPTPNGSIPSEG